jgi:hypothetical protein
MMGGLVWNWPSFLVGVVLTLAVLYLRKAVKISATD